MTTVWITVRRRSIENIGSIPVLTDPLKFGHSFGIVNICAASDNLNKFVFDSGCHLARTAGEELKKSLANPCRQRPSDPPWRSHCMLSKYLLYHAKRDCQHNGGVIHNAQEVMGKKLTDS